MSRLTRGTRFDLSLTGFDPKEIDELLVLRPDEQSLAATPALPALPVSAHGDLWVCGDHRVLCGDATNPEDVARLCASVTPAIMITDPPYGVDYGPGWRERAGLGKIRQVGTVENDDRVDWREAFQLFRGDVVYVWHAGLHAGEVADSLRQCGFEIRSQIIWGKQHFVLSRGHYHWQHEPCWYAVRRGKTGHWCGDRRQSTLWEVSNLNPFGGGSADARDRHSRTGFRDFPRTGIISNTLERLRENNRAAIGTKHGLEFLKQRRFDIGARDRLLRTACVVTARSMSAAVHFLLLN